MSLRQPPNDGSYSARQLQFDAIEKVDSRLQSKMKRKNERDDTSRNVEFLCQTDVHDVWSHQTISNVFPARIWQEEETYFVCRTFSKLLSVLVLIGFQNLTLEWFAAFLCPLDRIRALDASGAFRTDADLPINNIERLDFLASKAYRRAFHDKQFCLCPATIFETLSGDLQIIDPRKRLPFEWVKPEAFVGGYGQVQQAKVSGSYLQSYQGTAQYVNGPDGTVVALKIMGKLGSGFVREAENLKILKGADQSHKWIMQHIVAIQHGEESFILFPFAWHLDLEIFLHSGHSHTGQKTWYNFDNRFPFLTTANITQQMFDQAAKLADALLWLHSGIRTTRNATLRGVHMDLKPSNILIDQDPHFGRTLDNGVPQPPPEGVSLVGIWKISDFGISTFENVAHSAEAETVPNIRSIRDYYFSHTTMNIAPERGEGTYLAPEVHQSARPLDPMSRSLSARRGIGRKSDIWSFGCILSEILTFTLGNDAPSRRQLVEEFQDARMGKQGRSMLYTDDGFFRSIEDQSQPHGESRLQVPEAQRRGSYELRPEVKRWLRDKTSTHSLVGNWMKCCEGTILDILQVSEERRPSAARLKKMTNHLADHLFHGRTFENRNCRYLQQSVSSSAQMSPSAGASSSAYGPIEPGRLPTTLETARLESSNNNFAVRERSASDTITPMPGNFEAENVTAAQADIIISPPGENHPPPAPAPPPPAIPSPSAEEFAALDAQLNRSHRPPHAHGITINPLSRMNEPRSFTQFLQTHHQNGRNGRWTGLLRRNFTDVAISPDGNLIAYLNGNTVYILRYGSTDLSGTFVDTLEPIKLKDAQSWEHIAIGGSYFAVWGFCKKAKRKLVELHNLADVETHIEPPDQASIDLLTCVAVSSAGAFAFVCQKKIVFSSVETRASSSTRSRALLYPQFEKTFTCASFNDSGRHLYAWAYGGSEAQHLDHLYQWEIHEGQIDTKPASEGHYRRTLPVSLPLSLVPYNEARGAIIEAPRKTFFPAQFDRPSQRGGSIEYPRHNVPINDRLATCLFNDHSMIVVGKKVVKEYAILWGNLHALEIHKPGEVLSLQTNPSEHSKVKAVHRGRNIQLILCNLDGSIEVATISPMRSSSMPMDGIRHRYSDAYTREN